MPEFRADIAAGAGPEKAAASAASLPAALSADWPSFGVDDDIRPMLAVLRQAGEPAALATLFAADGGAPRGVGAQLLVGRGAVAGYLSGGCIEADVARHALEVVADGSPRVLVYGEGGPVDIQLPCGGHVEILVERLLPDDADAGSLLRAAEARRPAVWLSDGIRRACVSPDGVPAAFASRYARAARSGRYAGPAGERGAIFRKFMPRFRAVVIGHDPSALAIAALAALSGFETILVRPRGPAAPPPIAGVRYLRGDVRTALDGIGLDPWTAIATATHDWIDDHDALAAALPSPAAYVGLLGSRRRLEERLSALRACGIADESIARLRAPIGFDLRGSAPHQIALGAVAEMMQALAASSARAFVTTGMADAA